MACRRHPKGVLTSDGACWECAGRPPNWTCTGCGRHFPCEHIRRHPALTMAEADARSELLTAVEGLQLGVCGWDKVEERLEAYTRLVRSGYGAHLARRSRN